MKSIYCSLVGGVEPLDALDVQTVLYGYEVLCPLGLTETLRGRVHRAGDHGEEYNEDAGDNGSSGSLSPHVCQAPS